MNPSQEPIELQKQVTQLIKARAVSELRELIVRLDIADIAEVIEELSQEQEAVLFRLLPQETAVDVFELLPSDKRESLMFGLADKEAAAILDDMSPDDRTEFFEELPGKVTRRLMNLLSSAERMVATQLLGYPEDSIGRLMTPDYVALRSTWTVVQALEHIRIYGHDSETLSVLYVVEKGGKLIDDIRVREILLAAPDAKLTDLMDHQFVALDVMNDQEEAVTAFQRYDRTVLPVTDTKGILVGIVTVDDVLDVAEEEATEDIQKLGGVAALEEPYLSISLFKLIRKRSFWLVLLFFGQMLTATAMGFFQEELEKALVLALFVPLIISSGGNTGSQASTLIIRALTIGEIRLKDWWRVMRREVFSGLIMGGILGVLGFFRIALGEYLTHSYGQYWYFIGLTIGLSLLGIVMWGTLAGSLLPFVLERLGIDPATSSAPLVATLVDVTGLVIYFSVAAFVLNGTLL